MENNDDDDELTTTKNINTEKFPGNFFSEKLSKKGKYSPSIYLSNRGKDR